ncbi:MAG: argininosuccinate lyase [Propionibacteriales bacterium]|nr:argininosuccinate lyase [Propionibacteriales bacterium]
MGLRHGEVLVVAMIRNQCLSPLRRRVAGADPRQVEARAGLVAADEAGRIAFRLALRDQLLDLRAAVAGFGATVARRGAEHAETLWADSTYLQPAQPSTFGHYLGGFAEQAVRHLGRITAAYDLANVSPAGAGGVGGTRLPLDLARIAELLGFAAVGQQTRDAMWSTDALVDAVTAASQSVLTVDQLAEDLEVFASPAFDYVALDASLCRASVLMPQKRNPYALAVLRGGTGTLLGRLGGLLTTGRTPSARTDNWLYAYGEVTEALGLADRLVRLGTAVANGLRPNADVLREWAGMHHVGATDLAEDIAVQCRLDYRTAYRVVGRAVATAGERGDPELTASAVSAAAEALTGSPLSVPPALLAAALDPAMTATARNGTGGASPDRVREHAQAVRRRVDDASRWNVDQRARIGGSENALLDPARALLRTNQE